MVKLPRGSHDIGIIKIWEKKKINEESFLYTVLPLINSLGGYLISKL